MLWCVYCVRRWTSPFRRGGEASSFQTEILIRTACISVGNHNLCVYMSMYCVFAQLEVFGVCVLCCVCVPCPPRGCVSDWAVRAGGARGAADARVASRDEDDLNGCVYRSGAPLAVPWVYRENTWIKLQYISLRSLARRCALSEFPASLADVSSFCSLRNSLDTELNSVRNSVKNVKQTFQNANCRLKSKQKLG